MSDAIVSRDTAGMPLQQDRGPSPLMIVFALLVLVAVCYYGSQWLVGVADRALQP